MSILPGLFFVGWGLFQIWRSINLRINGIFTIGTVSKTRLTPRGYTELHISFKNLKGRTVVFRVTGWKHITINPFYKTESPIPVLYDPNDSRNAVIYTFDFMYAIPLFFVGIGSAFIYFGVTG